MQEEEVLNNKILTLKIHKLKEKEIISEFLLVWIQNTQQTQQKVDLSLCWCLSLN